jgi:hypothetical protein
MKYPKYAAQIIALKDADLKLRQQLITTKEFTEGYHKDMAALHNTNADILNAIITAIGYPTIAKVGKPANEAAWLVIQHAIAKPKFMKRCLKLLKKEVTNNPTNKIHYAYLSDRIAIFENKPQLYGTQFDWDEEKKMSAQQFDDLKAVNKRRLAIGLNTLEEQTKKIRESVLKENQQPPKDLITKRRQFKAWQKTSWLGLTLLIKIDKHVIKNIEVILILLFFCY